MTTNHLMHGHDTQHDFLLFLFLFSVVVPYCYAAWLTSRSFRTWPFARYIYCFIGTLCIALSMFSPIANLAHTNFTAHMISHLLLGMMAPLFIALAAPLTLLLRTLPFQASRKISRILRCMPIRMIIDPFIASILNIGGLSLLYKTNLYVYMHQYPLVYVFVHFHLFMAGYLITISMIYIDKPSHRTSYVYRGIAFVCNVAAHGVLSKTIYVNPPLGISAIQAETGAKLMYYGGDAIHALIMMIFFYQWFKLNKPLRGSLEISCLKVSNK